jgi:Fur family peroxide stress response transcriptional regulator
MKSNTQTVLKKTPQRLAIFEYLKDNTDHPSADEIYKAIIQKFPSMSFATVYNTLETLKEQGFVKELTIDPNKKHFDPNIESHHHLMCIKCKKIVDILVDYELQVPEHNKKGFDIIGNHIEFYGLCPSCKDKQNEHVQDNI